MFNPEDFFRLADRMLHRWKNEAVHRSVIGRSYYTCYLISRDRMFGADGLWLTEKKIRNILGRAGGRHEAVVRAILNAPGLGPGTAKVLSDQLGQLKDMRVQADYYCDPKNQRTVNMFGRYGVANWGGLAHNAMVFASMLLPSLKQLGAVP